MFHCFVWDDHHDKRKYQPILSKLCSISSKTREFNFTEIERESIGMTGLLSLDLLFPIGTSHFPDPFGATNIISLSMLGLYGLLSIGLYKERAKISAKLLGTDFQIC